jgi:hypothetical protein
MGYQLSAAAVHLHAAGDEGGPGCRTVCGRPCGTRATTAYRALDPERVTCSACLEREAPGSSARPAGYRVAGSAIWSPVRGGEYTLAIGAGSRTTGSGTRAAADAAIARHGFKSGAWCDAVRPVDGTVSALLYELDWSLAPAGRA